ncbi:MAG: glycosyltransferase family 9 protein [Calditrichaeota bacterium]|nr:glycosyltransferase family 9 protein [Calditrichota bacterium]
MIDPAWRKVLIVRNDRLGDAILALPAVRLVREQLPDAEIYLWLAKGVAPLGNCLKEVTGVIAGGDRSGDEALMALLTMGIDAAFCLRPTYHNARTLSKARIERRFGTSRRWYSPLFSDRIPLSRRNSDRHEADLNLDFLHHIGLTGEAKFPVLHLPERARNQAAELLRSTGLKEGDAFAVLHPGSGGSAREWPPQYFSLLAGRLKQMGLDAVVVTGLETESSSCIAASSRYGAINLCGRTDLLTLAAILNWAALFVSASTGPLHLMVALGGKAIGLYPPVADCLPSRWGPYGHPEWALMPDLPICSECKPGSCGGCFCMEQISVERVAGLAKHFLEA